MTQPPLPPWKEPVIDPATGQMTLIWRNYFEKQAQFMADHEARLQALEP